MPAIEAGFFRREIADAAYQYQCAVDGGKKKIVGVTDFVEREERKIELLNIDADVETKQTESLRRTKTERSRDHVDRTLNAVRRAAESRANVFPVLLDAARARATVGEIMDALADALGRYVMRHA